MKRLLALALALVLSLPIGAINHPKGFEGKLWASTLALYGTKGKDTRFICTAEPIEKIDGGYRILSAGHCVQEQPAGVTFSIAEEINGPTLPVTLVKAYDGDGMDFSLFDLKTTKTYQLFELGDENELSIGDQTINPNFSLGLGKQLSRGIVSSMPMGNNQECDDGSCVGKFLVQQYAGPGASGSAIISAKSHKVVGLLVSEFGAQVGFAIEPMSMFAKFLAGPGQMRKSDKAVVIELVSFLIPDADFTAQCGSAHPFKLTVHGPNPIFIQGGYKFQVQTDGFELSDDYYYDVPVFINASADGYRLESTKEGFSVEVIVLGKV